LEKSHKSVYIRKQQQYFLCWILLALSQYKIIVLRRGLAMKMGALANILLLFLYITEKYSSAAQIQVSEVPLIML